MQRKDCKPGTKIIIRGEIVRDDGKERIPICIKKQDGKYTWTNPGSLEPAAPEYDPKRKFRKGDIAKLDYKGRDRGVRIPEGTEVEILKDECDPHLIKVKVERHIDPAGWIYVDVDNLVLIKPIEEIEAEGPYCVEETGASFEVLFKKGPRSFLCMHIVYFSSGREVTREEAREKAQELCDELNRKHRESLNA